MFNKDNPILSLLVNIIIPVLLLEKMGGWWGAPHGQTIALLTALSLPIGYGLFEWIVKKNKSWIAILGVINVASTGLFVVLQLEGHFFAFKEASFPLLIGFFVWFSQKMNTPFFKALFYNIPGLDINKLNSSIKEKQAEKKIHALFNHSTKLFSGSFFLSALLNFTIAYFIFIPIEASDEVLRQSILNQQIARMTWMGYAMIGLPLTIVTGYIFWDFMRRMKKCIGLSFTDLVH